MMTQSHFSFFFFNDTATTEIYTLSLHDALPISSTNCGTPTRRPRASYWDRGWPRRSEEHTSELQSLAYLVCRLLLEKKKQHYKKKGLPSLKDTKKKPPQMIYLS